MPHLLVPAFILAVVASSVAWQDSPEAYFMTRDERREWELVKTDEDAQRFIDAFRARRDREFADAVRKRAELVDERIPLGEAKASTTLRGKIIMLLGAPADIRVRPIAKASGGSSGHPTETRKGGASDGMPKASVMGVGSGWVEYTLRYAANPDLGIPSEGWTIVIEANAASGKDRLKSGRDKKKLDDILDAAARTSFQPRGD